MYHNVYLPSNQQNCRHPSTICLNYIYHLKMRPKGMPKTFIFYQSLFSLASFFSLFSEFNSRRENETLPLDNSRVEFSSTIGIPCTLSFLVFKTSCNSFPAPPPKFHTRAKRHPIAFSLLLFDHSSSNKSIEFHTKN